MPAGAFFLMILLGSRAMAPWGETDLNHARRLGSAEIRAALNGNLVVYSPPGWHDAGAQEEFHPDGRWRGLRLSRGPIPFSGRWSIARGQLCVTLESGMRHEHLLHGPFCRAVWRDRGRGVLLMDHITAPGRGLMILSVRPLPPGA